MTTGTLIFLEEYLASTYEPDCDYVDGHLEERNLGELNHSELQMRVGSYLLTQYGKEVSAFTPSCAYRSTRASSVCRIFASPWAGRRSRFSPIPPSYASRFSRLTA